MPAKQSSYCGLAATPVDLPIWRELFFPAEWLGLVVSPVYRGSGIPKGNGEPVILVPGFLASDAAMHEMHLWLERISYDAHVGGINIDCPDVELSKLIEQIDSVRRTTKQPVRLIGHSLGGTLARAAAVKIAERGRKDIIAQVISLGSPLKEIRIHPYMMRLALAVESIMPGPDELPRPHDGHLHTGECAHELYHAMQQPFPPGIARASIYTKRDGVVDWNSSHDKEPGAINKDVSGTHVGLVVNAQAYRAIAELLGTVKTLSSTNGSGAKPRARRKAAARA